VLKLEISYRVEEEEEGANLDVRNIVAGSNAKYGWSCS
jgi:hypothetical protein